MIRLDDDLDAVLAQWRRALRRDSASVEPRVSRLRDELAALAAAGLTADESLVIALMRLARFDAESRAFVRAHAGRLWTHLVAVPGRTSTGSDALVAVALACLAAIAIKIPALFGVQIHHGGEVFYARNASLFVLPLLAAYLAWSRGAGRGAAWLAVPFLAAAAAANLFPFAANSSTEVLTAVHLPLALWLVVGLAFCRGRGLGVPAGMEFVRFSGELAIYYALIALGGGVFTGLTLMLFEAIGLKAETLAADWLVPCGAMGAVIVAAWLVEVKQSVRENLAPMLTRLFTPLFTVLLVVFLGTIAWTGRSVAADRNVLIGFDVLLAWVTALVLYAVSARDPQAPPSLFDRLQFLLVLCALAVDVVALSAIATRISSFGFTPNRVAALGENLLLLANLLGAAWFYARFLLRRGSFAALERWQVAYLPAYSAWAALVVVVFPPAFGYR